jgi:hypothetical protein
MLEISAPIMRHVQADALNRFFLSVALAQVSTTLMEYALRLPKD